MSDNYEKDFQDWLNSQSGYVGKTKKAEFKSNWEQSRMNQQRFNDIFDPSRAGIGISGSPNEVTGRLEGLERAKVLTGKNPYQVGQDYQEAFGNIQKRTKLADTGSEMLRASKAGAVADARNEMQRSGVKGGAAAGAVSSIERAKSYDVNNQLVENQRKAEQDYLNAAKANANFTQASEMNFGAMAAGKDFEAPSTNSNGFGTVICTELYRQGYYSDHLYSLDQEYGREVLATRPHVYWGYRLWADYVVIGMQHSKIFTKAVAFFALPWAKNMAGEKNLFGKILSVVGEAVCGLIGHIFGGFHAYNKKEV